MNIRKIAYNKYQLDWMKQHNFSLSELMTVLTEIQDEDLSVSVDELFDEFEFTIGFRGVVWSSYSEFLDNEYQDEEYMKELLTNEEYTIYKKERMI